MAQLAIKNLSKLTPFAGGPWNFPNKFHLYWSVMCRYLKTIELIYDRMNTLYNSGWKAIIIDAAIVVPRLKLQWLMQMLNCLDKNLIQMNGHLMISNHETILTLKVKQEELDSTGSTQNRFSCRSL